MLCVGAYKMYRIPFYNKVCSRKGKLSRINFNLGLVKIQDQFKATINFKLGII